MACLHRTFYTWIGRKNENKLLALSDRSSLACGILIFAMGINAISMGDTNGLELRLRDDGQKQLETKLLRNYSG